MKANRSKTYLLPLLFKEITFNMRHFSKIKNVFIRSTHAKYKYCIFLEFSVDEASNFSFLEELQSNSLFREYIIEDSRIIFIFDFPKKFIKEYNFFKLSKYSKFGADSKAYITKF